MGVPPGGRVPSKDGSALSGAAACLILAVGIIYIASILNYSQVLRVAIGMAGTLFLVPAILLGYRHLYVSPTSTKSHSTGEPAVLGLAIVIIVLSFGLLSWFAVMGNVQGMSAAGAVVGTWVGAVVTFYFTRNQATVAREAGAKAGTEAFSESQHAVALLQAALNREKSIVARLAKELRDREMGEKPDKSPADDG